MQIADTTPNNGAEGVALASVIQVLFDEEADRDSIIRSGNFVVVTSASKVVKQGPGLENLNAIPDDLLASDVFSGFVEGQIATEDNITFTFTPASPLQPDRLYRVILSSKIRSRTIEGIVADAGNTSTGSFRVRGPYTDSIQDAFTIEVSTGGALGLALFTYTRASTGLTSAPIVTDRVVDLEDGVRLEFTSGAFVVGDEWAFDVQPGDPLEDIYEFSFTTGASSHVQVSEDTPSFQLKAREIKGLKRIDGVPASDSGTLALVSITPEHQDTNVLLSNGKVVLTFNKPIDPESVSAATIEVLMESLPFDERAQNSHPLRVTPLVSGNTLTLTFSG